MKNKRKWLTIIWKRGTGTCSGAGIPLTRRPDTRELPGRPNTGRHRLVSRNRKESRRPAENKPQFYYICSAIGVLAQLVERKVRNLKVRGSIPLYSTDSSILLPSGIKITKNI